MGRLIGEQVERLRREKQLTLGAVADGTGLTRSFLSKLERGLTSISVDNLRSIARFLGVDMVSFFRQDVDSNAIVIRKGGGTPLSIGKTRAESEALITTSRSALQATLYKTAPGKGRTVGFSHPGQEFVFVIRGEVVFAVGSEKYSLKAGDSLWFLSTEPHGWQNLTKVTAVTLHVNTPPLW